jgi:molybdate/tungstate transport system substrate-binding protein
MALTRGLRSHFPYRRLHLAAMLITTGALLAACGASSSTATSPTPNRGPVDVLYAGSLVNLMEKSVGPQFGKVTGYQFVGFGAGSSVLASDIKGKVRQGDVFISASPAVNATLQGSANGDWVAWYATFATSKLVIGYNPRSNFASQLQSQPWYQVITQTGFRIGRTDPVLDPKGKLTVTALTQAATMFNKPALTAITKDTNTVFPEEALVGRLQAGQLDAGFFYTIEATQAKIQTIPIDPISLNATYTITILNQAPHQAGALAFVRYLLGSGGQSFLASHGLTLVNPPTVSGSGVPSSLTSVIPAAS